MNAQKRFVVAAPFEVDCIKPKGVRIALRMGTEITQRRDLKFEVRQMRTVSVVPAHIHALTYVFEMPVHMGSVELEELPT